MPTTLDEDCCTVCGNCLEVCRYGVYEKLDEKPQVAHVQYCKDCGNCIKECPSRCISFREALN
ncbi:MAG: 4Fe-4S dicluster domain-containing protein [Candidatus Thorarchaeota archaeon]